MRSCRRLVLLTACILLDPLSVLAQAAPRKKMPVEVQRHIITMAQSCKQAGAIPAKSPDLLVTVDLTGDGIADYVIDEGQFNCEGAASMFSGTAGAGLSVYVGRADGGAFKAFESFTFGAKVDKTGTLPRLLVTLAGADCGQRGADKLARAALKSCWRPLDWNAAQRKMVLAPLSQIRPID